MAPVLQFFLASSRFVLLVAVLGIAHPAVVDGDEAPIGPAKARPSVVYLDAGKEWGFTVQRFRVATLLSRELVRQSLLVGARDELSLPIRDYWLGDLMPMEGDNPPIEVLGSVMQPNVLRLKRKFGEFEEAEAPELMKFDQGFSYKLLLQRCEAWSRDGWLKLLKQWGFDGAPNKAGTEDVPLDVEALLQDMNAISQFQAVRQLHALIREKGESRQLVGGLVRGYANLGVLTEPFLHPAHKVFKARALVYAQRLRMKDGLEVYGKWHRAYAFALAGIQAEALADVEETKQLASDAEKNSVPVWLGLIEAYCRYQTPKLKPDDAPEGYRQLTALLQFLAQAGSGSANLSVTAGRELLAEAPECYLAYDIINRLAPLGVLHEMTAMGPRTLAGKLYPRLQKVDGLPSDVVALVKNHKLVSLAAHEQDERMAIVKALLDSESPDEKADKASNPAAGDPTWATLGLIIRETGFVQVHQRVAFEAQTLGTSPDRTLASAKRLYRDHPLRPIIESYSWDPAARKKAVEEVAKLNLDGLDFRAITAFWNMATANPAMRAKLGNIMARNQDTITGDLLLQMYRSDGPKVAMIGQAQALASINRESPLAFAILLEVAAEITINGDPKAIEEKAADHPVVWASLGRRSLREKNYNDAERYLKKAIELGQERGAYKSLAEVYQAQGNQEQWLETLQDFLKTPSQGLEHARVQSDIADYYITRNDWDKAWPFARDSAETYWARGLIQAGCVAEARQEWESAEQYFRSVSTRYPNEVFRWYQFCVRTGQGDVNAARPLAEAYVKMRVARGPDGPQNGYPIVYFYFEKRFDDGITYVKNSNDPYLQMWGMVFACAKGDTKLRDEFIATALEKSNGPNSGLTKLIKLIQADVAAGGESKLSLNDAIKACEGDPEGLNYALPCLLGVYLSHRQNNEAAVQCWKAVMGLNDIEAIDRAVAGSELWAHGIAPSAYRDQLQPVKPE